ncbi:phage head-binding domain-containing protein [Escherichia coli]
MSDITANVVVSMPSQLFTMARSFKAVANGKIYIGKIDTDPVNPENQIQVYVENEDGSHVPVSQPIIINAAGYPVYNGQIAKFVTVQGHSMAVYDAYGAQQFYFPNVLKYDPDQFKLLIESSLGASHVGYQNPLGDTLLTVGGALDEKYPNVIGSIVGDATGYKFDSFKRYIGNHDYQYKTGGSARGSTKYFSKSGNATITLAGQRKTFTVDTVAYTSIDNTDPADIGYPQYTELRNLTFKGNGATSQWGLTITNGQNYTLENINHFNSGGGLLLGDVWMSSVRNCTVEGQLRQDAGTSMTYQNCFAKVTDTSVSMGAYRFSSLLYSTLSGLGSDGTVRTAYYFDSCYAVSLKDCGCEHPSRADSSVGVAIHFNTNNNMTVENFACVPNANETSALISIGAGNRIIFKNLQFYFDNTHTTDILITGGNNFIHFEGGSFGSNSTDRTLPVVGTLAGADGTVLSADTGFNRYIYRCTSTPVSPVPWEPMYASGSFIPDIRFGGVPSGEYTYDCKYTKNGNTVTVEGLISFTALGTGALTINNLPYNAAQLGSGVVSSIINGSSNVTSASVIVSRANPLTLSFQKTVNGSTGPLGNGDISSNSSIRFSITYNIVSYWN